MPETLKDLFSIYVNNIEIILAIYLFGAVVVFTSELINKRREDKIAQEELEKFIAERSNLRTIARSELPEL